MMQTAFVIGSGIAGLSIAEILSRNGWKVVLVEKKKKIGGEASLSTQKWLHTGWLYAALPYTAAMIGCYRSLQLYHTLYGSVFPEDRLNLSMRGGKTVFISSKKGWFKDDRIHYLYAIDSFDMSFWEKRYWRHYLELVPFRRLHRLGYPVKPLKRIPFELASLLNHWEDSKTGYKKYKVVLSTDAKIQTRRILCSLASVLSNHTEIVTDADTEFSENRGYTSIGLNGSWHKPDLVVFASGQAIREHLKSIDAAGPARMIKSIKSPILVLKKKLALPNFIRFTHNLPYSINHIKYPIAGTELSTVGGYIYYPFDVVADTRPFVSDVCKRLKVAPDSVAGSYFGTKTEYTGKVSRCYNHALEKVNQNTYLALAGKFCQFPLLVSEFMAQVALKSDIQYESRAGFGDDIIGLTVPEKIYKKSAVNSFKDPAAVNPGFVAGQKR